MKLKAVSLFVIAGLVFLSFMNGSQEPREGLEVGDKAPEINARLINGKGFSTDSLKGKMILVSFWASYDAPSRIENFRKKVLLDQYRLKSFYKSKGLVVVSVSLDRFKAPYLSSIGRDGIENFYHLCDFKGRESKLAEVFSVEDQMMSFLIDGEGRIVDRSSDLGHIEATLQRLDAQHISHLAFGSR